MNARERISKVIISAMEYLPFYSELMIRSKIVPFTDAIKSQPNYCPTMAVGLDGSLYYDEEFVNKLSEKELMYVILHESLHKAYLHLHRIHKRDPILWNIAADVFVDYEVKSDLIGRQGIRAEIMKGRIVADSNGTIKLPMFGVEMHNIQDKTVEQIYDELANNKNVQKAMQKMKAKAGGSDDKGNEKGALGEDVDMHAYTGEDGKKPEDMTPAELEELAERAKDDVMEAATKCKRRGSLPKGLERKLNKLLETKIDWRQYIYRYVVNELPYDYTLSKPSRRYLSQGMYLPGTIKENLDVVALIDLSGSVSDEHMNQFVSLLAKLSNQFRNLNVTIVSHDHEVQAVTEIQQATKEKIKNAEYKGGGGTSHVPAFKWIDDNKRNVPIVIAFTDGYTRFPEQKPRYPVLWVLTKHNVGKDSIPFGHVIKIEDVVELN